MYCGPLEKDAGGTWLASGIKVKQSNHTIHIKEVSNSIQKNIENSLFRDFKNTPLPNLSNFEIVKFISSFHPAHIRRVEQI